MTLKEFLKKIPVPFFNDNERKEKLIISNKISLIVYPNFINHAINILFNIQFAK